MARMLLWSLVLCAVVTQEIPDGCVVFCGILPGDCLSKCSNARFLGLENTTVPTFRLESLGLVDTKSEITGSDGFQIRPDGLVYFTTREGDVWRLLPKPKDGVAIKKIYRLPEALMLDTANDKGLYDIAFLRNFAVSRVFYLVFAARSNNPEYDHVLTVAEFQMNVDESIVYVGLIEQLPQRSSYRSGGFMKGAADASTSGHLPLWVSSGGNQDHDPELLQQQPKYSSIYGLFPQVAYRGDAHLRTKAPREFALWANGLANPYECDYAPTGFPEAIVCLTRHYDALQRLSSVALFRAEMGHTFNEETAQTMSTVGYSTYTQSHSYTDVFDARRKCVPDSIIFTGSASLLGTPYANRVILAFPTCEEGGFPDSKLQVLVRESVQRKWTLVDIAVDFGGRKLWGMQLIGAELSFGMFLSGRDLVTNQYEIYWVKPV